jgi:nucleotide-binding universal stress UspA family protein
MNAFGGSTTINTIVVGTDGSEHGRRAVEFAAGLAKQLDAEVTLVHVVELFPTAIVTAGGYMPYVPQSALDERLAAVDRAVKGDYCAPLRAAGVTYQTRILEGAASTVLAEVAAEVDAQLIVVGTRALHAFGEFFLGSTSHALTQHSPVPIIVVPLGRAAAKPHEEPAERTPAIA